MGRRPTVADLARAAGVSVATVDRVLNGRLPVREETARRVYDASKAIGFHAVSLIRQRLQQDLPQRRLGFLLQRPDQYFFQTFAKELERAVAGAADIRGVAQVEYLASQTPTEIAARLREMAVRCQAIAMVAVDHPTVTSTVAELKDRGIPVFALLSDAAPGVRESYVGVNNRKVGRTAAWMIAKAAPKPGRVAIFVGSHRFHGHEMREIGFRSYFREYAPQFTLADTVVNLEDQRIAHEATLDLFQRFPDLAGFYVAGGGMEGAISALREEDMAGRVVAVCNELTPESSAALADNVITMVIATPLARLSDELVAHMVGAIDGSGAATPGQVFLPFEIYIPENI